VKSRKSEMRGTVYRAIEQTEGLDPDERARRREFIDELLEKHADPVDAFNAYLDKVGDNNTLQAQLTEVMQRGIKYGCTLLDRCLKETMGPNEAFGAFSFAAGQARRLMEMEVEDKTDGEQFATLLRALGAGMHELGYATSEEIKGEGVVMRRIEQTVNEVLKNTKKKHEHPEGEYCDDCGKEHVKVPPGGILLIALQPDAIRMLAAGRVIRLPDSGKFLRHPIMLAQKQDLGPEGVAAIMEGLRPRDVESVPWATGLLVSKKDIGRPDVLDFISRPDVEMVTKLDEPKGPLS
jgi:hypothetical protein